VGRLGVVGGTATAGLELSGGDWVAINRHGDPYTLPHLIDHEANLRRLAEQGCDRVLALCAVGGLQPQLGPGTFMCPDDFVALDTVVTTLKGTDAHRVPGFDPEWRPRVVEAWASSVEAPLVDGGTYWNSIGPRLETPAEIRVIARDADVIGMTMAPECVVAGEMGLAYAAVCAVVNYANGIGEEPLTAEEVERGAEEIREQLLAALEAVFPALAAG
jgi:5'-methylthioadenosine phosphorylase